MKQSLQQNVQILWLPYSCKLKIICIGVRIWSLGILNFFAAQDFRKDPSSMVNLALHFAHLVPEDQLEGRVFSVIFTVVDQTFFK